MTTPHGIESDAMDAYSRAVSGAAERVGPAVVKSRDRGARRAARPRGRGAGLSRTARHEDGFQAAGSGVIYDSHGRVITNAHVVQAAPRAGRDLGRAQRRTALARRRRVRRPGGRHRRAARRHDGDAAGRRAGLGAGAASGSWSSPSATRSG